MLTCTWHRKVRVRTTAVSESLGIMDLLILGPPTRAVSPRYCGTYRTVPHYVAGISEDHPANQAFFWYCSIYPSSTIRDLSKAQALVEAYCRLQSPQRFEIVEVTTGNRPPVARGRLLGFDLSASYHFSLLSWGLHLDPGPLDNPAPEDRLHVLKPLFRLIEAHFRPQLNTSGLFNDYETASLCLDCMMALQQIRPNLWENEAVMFEVVGLWLIEPS